MTVGRAFDYVVVGAGSAGCVLAGRLSEDADARVLVLEAGGPDRNPLIHIPLGLGKMHEFRMYDWGYETEPEPGMGGRRIETMRGKVVGGSSSINVMAYVRGNRGDYDRWARNGATGWSYADILPYFRRSESFEGGADPWRGGDGPLTVTFARSTDPLFDAWIEAAGQIGLPFTPDYNGRQQVGVGRAQSTIGGGRRCSAAVAFLHPARRRPNLTVETGALATRVLIEDGRAVGVEYRQGGRLRQARAEREVLLSGGVVNSPQLLMLSGIGPADHLRSVGIDPLVDLKGVGQNLQDHLALLVIWSRPHPGPFHGVMRFDRMALGMLRAHFFGSGPGTVLPGGLHAFVKTRPDLEVPDIQYMFRGLPPDAHLWFPGIKKAYTDGYGIRPALLHPKSRGEIRLASADPTAKPRLIQNFLSHPDDLPALRAGFKLARETGYQKALDSYRGAEVAPGKKVRTDDEIDAYIRRTTVTAHHVCGTCRMGTDDDAVLDPDLKVRGVEGLRVVDAAAMPDLVSGNINACVIMIGEKGAALIRGEKPLPRAEEI